MTPWGTWLTGEENTVGAEQGYGAEHGYVFEVDARATSTVEPVPIKAMGRMVHEACPVDPRTGIVYQTEDNGDPGDGFYRYLPDHKGKLHLGGKLQMLAIKGRPKYNTTKNQTVGEKLECSWVDIKDPDPNGADRYPQAVYMQGRHAGGAKFMGLEGGTFSKGSCYFTASDGGNQEQGQIWKYTPDNKNFKHGTLELVYESPKHRVLSGPDAITQSPRGGILVSEDGSSEDVPGQPSRMMYVTPNGDLELFGRVTEPMQLHDTSPRTSSPTTRSGGTTRPPRARASVAARSPGSASAPTASGSSATSSIRASRSRSPGPGTRAGCSRSRFRRDWQS